MEINKGEIEMSKIVKVSHCEVTRCGFNIGCQCITKPEMELDKEKGKFECLSYHLKDGETEEANRVSFSIQSK